MYGSNKFIISFKTSSDVVRLHWWKRSNNYEPAQTCLFMTLNQTRNNNPEQNKHEISNMYLVFPVNGSNLYAYRITELSVRISNLIYSPNPTELFFPFVKCKQMIAFERNQRISGTSGFLDWKKDNRHDLKFVFGSKKCTSGRGNRQMDWWMKIRVDNGKFRVNQIFLGHFTV